MSVYTRIERNELEDFLQSYPLGKLIDYQGISDGIENTNYFVTTSDGEYVLTLFEGLGADDLPYFLNLVAFLSEHDVPCAHPLANSQQYYLATLKQKPAALVQRLPGKAVTEPTPIQCTALGDALGRLHTAGQSFEEHRVNERGPHWWKQTVNRLASRLNDDDIQLLDEELHYQASFRLHDLPRGVIHADLFRDNVLFVDNKLTGIIDFYYACDDVLLYDVAVTANDWCSQPDGSLNEDKLKALLSAYDNQRKLTSIEQNMWAVLLRAAALRFWLSRLQDMHFPREGEITNIHDPDVFKRILLSRINKSNNLRTFWVV